MALHFVGFCTTIMGKRTIIPHRYVEYTGFLRRLQVPFPGFCKQNPWFFFIISIIFSVFQNIRSSAERGKNGGYYIWYPLFFITTRYSTIFFRKRKKGQALTCPFLRYVVFQ